ncbi:xanthine dehydrogenase family protein molybdopterin-binding subunit [Xylophilus sp. ASV27]|uniref:xanthine dehydrogenase family protein molybdopterin-binding subunit n=1 Tax=Xylophilus sp. ASV27 TaxID=2795129 RepID=UPI0018ED142E|nr:xanthine dehydrogenase family protein molybdopterin-binding subunit [Xylophilus sp. ASV27]
MKKNSVIGQSVKRSDLLAKVTGTAQYVADMHLPGLLYARSKRSDVAHALIRRIDTRRALALPGVKAVLTHENVPRVLHAGSPHPRSASVTCDQYILDRKVRYWGETVAVVAATSEEVAEAALELIEVEYEPLPAMFTVEDAAREGATPIHDREPGGNLVLAPVVANRGDVERGFAEADFILEGEYEGGRPTPAYMEPNACMCQWDGNGNLTVWISTQTAFMVRGIMAEVLGLPLSKVRVLVDHMGGGFGAKQDLFQSEFLCALLARQTRRPVRMEFTREETFLGGRTRHPAKIWLKQGFRNDGTVTARQARVVFNSGAYGSHGPGVTTVGTTALTSLYRCDNVQLEGRCVYTNSPIAGAFRGYGVVQTYYALDIQMDEAAHRLGMDPAELKLRNAVREGDIAPSGHALIGHGLEDCIRRGMQEVDWPALRQRPRDTGVRRRGWGLGCEMHGSSAYPGIKEQGNAIVKMNEDGTVVLLTGTAGLGTGAHTALAQIVAEELGLRFEAVSVMHGDTDVVPWDIGAFASHTTYLGGRAAQLAAQEIKRQLFERAAALLQAEAGELESEDGVIHVRGTGRSISVRDAVAPRKGVPAAQLVGSATYHPTKSYSFAAHFVEVDVDTETGQISVLQVVPVHEIGKVIHPIAAAGQIEGGIQQGIGHTLYEDYQIDMATGRSLNANFVDYKMPLSMDMPSIRTVILETAPDPGGPFGAKGVGEDPIVAIGPAIANAVFDAIGVRFRHYPIKPEQVLQALRDQAAPPPPQQRPQPHPEGANA